MLEEDVKTPKGELGERNVIAIHIEDLTNRRLLEGLASQLNLEARFASDDDLADPEFTQHVALIVADEPPASRYRALPTLPDQSGDGSHPALVAVLPTTYSGTTVIPRKNEQPFDGILVLPQLPGVVLAQLSVILYAHRKAVKRYSNAMEELLLNRRIFRSVTSGISIADVSDPDLVLSYVNPAFEVITGYSLEEVEGKNCRFLQGADRDQPGLVLIREAIANQRPLSRSLRITERMVLHSGMNSCFHRSSIGMVTRATSSAFRMM